MPDRRRCNRCGQYRPVEQTALIGRYSGGNYRRAGSSKPTGICDDCVRELYRRIGPRPGHALGRIDRWSASSIIRQAVRIGEPHCTVVLVDDDEPWMGSDGPIICKHYAEDGDCGGYHARR